MIRSESDDSGLQINACTMVLHMDVLALGLLHDLKLYCLTKVNACILVYSGRLVFLVKFSTSRRML